DNVTAHASNDLIQTKVPKKAQRTSIDDACCQSKQLSNGSSTCDEANPTLMVGEAGKVSSEGGCENTCGEWTNHVDQQDFTLSFEIKPKKAYMTSKTSGTGKAQVCKFCMHQCLKGGLLKSSTGTERKENMSPQETETLIREMEKRSLLWNTKSPFYKDQSKRMDAWREIARAVYPDITPKGKIAEVKKVKDLQARWKSMRDSYTKYMRRLQINGDSSHSKYKPYVYAPQLAFLEKVLSFRLEKRDNKDQQAKPDSQQQEGELEEPESEETPEDMEGEDSGAPNIASSIKGDSSVSTITSSIKGESSVPNITESSSPDLAESSSYIEPTHKHSQKLRISLGSFKPDPDAESSQNLDGASETFTNMHRQSAMEENDFRVLEDVVQRIVKKEVGMENEPDMAFFNMLLPTLRNFTEDQKLEFRTEVLLIMRAIKAGTNKTALAGSSGDC
ncbi:hypothetical protein EGW08_010101, partial [Elysia chlorotica]